MVSPRRRAAGLLALTVIVLVGTFFLLFERREITQTKGLSGEAARNPLAALQRLVKQKGLPASAYPALIGLPATDRVLVMLSPRRTLRDERAEEILDWVSAGGRLIVTPRKGRESWASDPFLLPLGVGSPRPVAVTGKRPKDKEEATPDQPQTTDQRGAADRQASQRQSLSLRAAKTLPPRKVLLPPAPLLHGGEEKATFWEGSEQGAFLARFAWGEGSITLLSNASFLYNDRIGEAEHARFAWDLLHFVARPPAGVSLVWTDQVAPLHHLILKKMRPALLSLLLLIAAWLWHRGVTFGPPLYQPPAARRGLLEHVRASGELLWRHRQHQPLLHSQRQHTKAYIDRRLAQWTSLDKDKGLDRLAEVTSLPREDLRHALYGHISNHESELTQMVRTLEQIRRSL